MVSVIFDLDGTLIKSTEIHAKAFVQAFREFGYDVREEEVKKLVGISGREIVKRIAGKYIKEIRERKIELFHENLEKVEEIAGATEVLKELKKKFSLGLVTSCNKKTTFLVLEKFGWEFDVVITPDDVERGKPEPNMLALAVEKIGGPTVYVGDSIYDKIMCKWCGVEALILGENISSLKEVLGYKFKKVKTHELADREIVGTPVYLSKNHARAILLAKENMKVDEDGLIHGSFTFGVADLAAMLSFNKREVLLKKAEVNFLRKVYVGDVLVAEAFSKGTRAKVSVKVKDREVFKGEMEVWLPCSQN